MNKQLHIPPAALKEIPAPSHLREHIKIVIDLKFNKFIRVYVDIEKLRIAPYQSAGYV